MLSLTRIISQMLSEGWSMREEPNPAWAATVHRLRKRTIGTPTSGPKRRCKHPHPHQKWSPY